MPLCAWKGEFSALFETKKSRIDALSQAFVWVLFWMRFFLVYDGASHAIPTDRIHARLRCMGKVVGLGMSINTPLSYFL